MGREFASASSRWLHLRRICRGGDHRRVRHERSESGVVPPGRGHEVFLSGLSRDAAKPEVEAVYAAVPHNLHAKVYGDVIRAGKHLIGESRSGWI
jgi:predicted dehydrogenase